MGTRKSKETILEFYKGAIKVYYIILVTYKMVEYSEVNCKLSNVQLNKLKKAVKSNEGAILR